MQSKLEAIVKLDKILWSSPEFGDWLVGDYKSESEEEEKLTEVINAKFLQLREFISHDS